MPPAHRGVRRRPPGSPIDDTFLFIDPDHGPYFADVLRLAPGTLRLFPDFTSISVVRVKGDRRMAGSLCDTAHLEPVE